MKKQKNINLNNLNNFNSSSNNNNNILNNSSTIKYQSFLSDNETGKNINQNNIINAKNFEIDKQILNEIYNKHEKPKNIYNVVEKKTIFDKEFTKTFPNINKSENYYSNYQSFRDFLSTGFTYDYTLNEINKLKSLLKFSYDLRQNISNKFGLSHEVGQLNSILLDEKNIDKKQLTSIFNNYLNAKNFVKICKLLKTKEKPNLKIDNNYLFRLFSSYEKDTDVFSIPPYENFMKIKYIKQNKKLTKLYFTENNFVKCVAEFKKKFKKNIKKNNIDSMLNFKGNLKVPYIQSFFHGRDDDYFQQLDNFINIYKDNKNLKRKEKELFSSLYEILSKCNPNCINFLQYLYSNSSMFKYIYDIFTIENKIDIMSKENIPNIIEESLQEPFLNDSTREIFNLKNDYNNKDLLKQEKNEKEENKKIMENLEIFFGNSFLEKIVFCEESFYESEPFKNFLDIEMIKNEIINTKNLQYDSYLLLNFENKIIIFKPIYLDSKYYFINDNINICKMLIIYFNEHEDLYNDNEIDYEEEKIFILKVQDKKKNKFFMGRIDNDDLDQLKKVTNEFNFIHKFGGNDIQADVDNDEKEEFKSNEFKYQKKNSKVSIQNKLINKDMNESIHNSPIKEDENKDNNSKANQSEVFSEYDKNFESSLDEEPIVKPVRKKSKFNKKNSKSSIRSSKHSDNLNFSSN